MSNYAILNRPQRSQRGSLCVCQALHPADIQSLVRPVTPQRPPKLAALQIPHLDRAIIPATDQPLAIRAALERLDRPLMGLAHPHALPMPQVPPTQHAIAAATKQVRSRAMTQFLEQRCVIGALYSIADEQLFALFKAFWSFGVILFVGRHWWRTTLLATSVAFVVLIGPSRIYLGDH